MSAAKRMKLTLSEKDDWRASSWYVTNCKDTVGSYHLEVPT